MSKTSFGLGICIFFIALISVKTPGNWSDTSSGRNSSPEKSKSPAVRDSSHDDTIENEENPVDSVSTHQADDTAKELCSTTSEMLNNPEALSLLQSIATEVKTQGEKLNAFIASQHEFRKQVCNDMAGIKNFLELDNARYVKIVSNFGCKSVRD